MVNQNWLFKGWLGVVFGLITMMLPIYKAEATHLRAGQITVEKVNPANCRQVKITVKVYTDTESSVLFGGSQDILDFGDGNQMLVPETPNEPYPGGGSIGVAFFSYVYTYGGPGKYTISYIEPNRNAGVLNMANSVGTTFYLETQVDLSALGCNTSPVLLVPPIDRACTGVAFYHNPGAYDKDGDSLSYELVVPFRDKNTEVTAYRAPNDASFYNDFLHGNEEGDGKPTFKIDSISGTLIWDAPSLPQSMNQGEFNIAFIVKEWRYTNGVWVQIGFVRRDMQIIVERCTNDRPELQIPEDICVIAGDPVSEIIIGTDPNNHNVKIEVFSEILVDEPPFPFPSPATYQPDPAVFQPQPAQLQFDWNTTCEHVKDQPYQVVFKVTDNPPLGPRLVTFETWRITVVAPPPLWESTPSVVDVAKRHVLLDWQPYACADEASKMQVWRKVGDTNFTPSECQTGLPESLGYTLIAQVPISQTSFNDTNGGKGLDVGAAYCYRLVATFPPPRGGESIVSDEICIEPINADAPVITNVTIDKTGDTDGEITIKWTPPFDINPVQFPGPYEYLVQRANGTGFVNASGNPPATISATSFTEAGLDTRDVVHFYRIVLYSPTNINPVPQAIDTSALASSVSLDLKAKLGEITLNWTALVPWSNQLQAPNNLHDVYRGPAGSTEADLQLIGTFTQVDVLQEGFTFIDTGLEENTEYCYKVMTRGGYGNPSIPEPLENYSQISCAFPRVDEPPCPPVLEAFVDDCKDNDGDGDIDFGEIYGCNPTNFTNPVTWSLPEGACAEDVRSYNVYVSGSLSGAYSLLAQNVRDTFYLDKGLASLARCYRISAVDRSGIEGELSDPICNDNCPYYELPNVFTPGDGRCNDFFSAYGVDLDANEISDCLEIDKEKKCARFVLQVDFNVFNRWGKKLYSYVGRLGDDNNSIYIKWDGRDDNGSPLPSGIYYYSAEVTFDVVTPSDKVKFKKGWIHLNRYSN